MKKTPVVVLAVLAVAFSAYAEAAKPRKRSRNSDRIGPYAVGFAGQTSYTSDGTEDEGLATEILLSFDSSAERNLSSSTDDSDLGYQAAFGYRFNRHLAAELTLLQLGEMVSTARGELDFGAGFEPSSTELAFKAAGPMVSALGILPINDRVEFFARAGYLLASSRRELRARIGDERGNLGSGRGDSQDLILGAGFSLHFGQVYSLRVEYLRIGEVGDGDSGSEEANMIGAGLVVRF
jgi:hypothetical protein